MQLGTSITCVRSVRWCTRARNTKSRLRLVVFYFPVAGVTFQKHIHFWSTNISLIIFLFIYSYSVHFYFILIYFFFLSMSILNSFLSSFPPSNSLFLSFPTFCSFEHLFIRKVHAYQAMVLLRWFWQLGRWGNLTMTHSLLPSTSLPFPFLTYLSFLYLLHFILFSSHSNLLDWIALNLIASATFQHLPVRRMSPCNCRFGDHFRAMWMISWGRYSSFRLF